MYSTIANIGAELIGVINYNFFKVLIIFVFILCTAIPQHGVFERFEVEQAASIGVEGDPSDFQYCFFSARSVVPHPQGVLLATAAHKFQQLMPGVLVGEVAQVWPR